MHGLKIAVVVVSALAAHAACAASDLRACVGKICVRPRISLEKEVIATYGPGFLVRGGAAGLEDDRTRCYRDTASKSYVLVTFWHAHGTQMRVSEVFVSTEKLCQHPAPAARPFGPVRFGVPIAIGDSEASVAKKLGRPQRVDDSKELEAEDPKLLDEPGFGSRYGEKKWVYSPEGEDSLLGWTIHFHAGKVKSLGLLDSP